MATLATTLITFGSLAGGANGAITVTYEQVGGDVVLNYSGTFDIDGFSPGGFTVSSISSSGSDDRFRNFQGEFSRILSAGTIAQVAGGSNGFFTNDFVTIPASATSGDTFAIEIENGFVYAPSGYTAGQNISGSATFSGQTIAGLGLVDSSFDIGAGGTVSFSSASAIPEPSSAFLLGVGALGFVSRRKRNI